MVKLKGKKGDRQAGDTKKNAYEETERNESSSAKKKLLCKIAQKTPPQFIMVFKRRNITNMYV